MKVRRIEENEMRMKREMEGMKKDERSDGEMR
jgi:hypothetical protein